MNILEQIESLKVETMLLEDLNQDLQKKVKDLKQDVRTIDRVIKIMQDNSSNLLEPILSMLDSQNEYTKLAIDSTLIQINENKIQFKKLNKAIDSLQTLLPDNNINPI